MEIKIITTDYESKQPIDARKLYLSLGYHSGKFNRWSKTNIEENPYFFENTDWCKVETIIFENETNFENFDNDSFEEDFQKNNSKYGILEAENIKNNSKDGILENDKNEPIDKEMEQKRSYQKKDFALTFDMAYHLTLQSSTPIAHEVRQALINQKKATALKEKQIVSLTQEEITDSERYQAIKKVNFESAKEMRYLEAKAKKRRETLNCLILGSPVIDTSTKIQKEYEQLNLFESNKKQLKTSNT